MKSIDDKITLLILTFLLIACTFIGVSLNGGDKGNLYLNGFFRDFIALRWDVFRDSFYILVLISTICLYLIPLFFLSKHRKKIFIIVPLIYLLLTLISFPLFIILLIPFILVWIILILVTVNYDKKTLLLGDV